MKRVFIVDDEPIVAKAIAQSLLSLGCEAIYYSNPLDCLEAVRFEQCDLLISDVNMPEMNGLVLLSRVKAVKPLLPVLMISGFGDIPMAVKAVKDGALDFVEKPLDEATLLPAVQLGLKSAELQSRYEISPAEAVVLKYVAAGKSNKEIAFILDRSVRTIENHRQRLMKKLNVDNGAGLVKIAVALGLA